MYAYFLSGFSFTCCRSEQVWANIYCHWEISHGAMGLHSACCFALFVQWHEENYDLWFKKPSVREQEYLFSHAIFIGADIPSFCWFISPAGGIDLYYNKKHLLQCLTNVAYRYMQRFSSIVLMCVVKRWRIYVVLWKCNEKSALKTLYKVLYVALLKCCLNKILCSALKMLHKIL